MSDSGGPPVLWRTLGAQEAVYEWEDLRRWVLDFRLRFPIHSYVLDCWYWHNPFVELLAALRDHERASYARAASGTAAMDWHHARHQAELQLEMWARRLTCTSGRRDHPPVSGPDDQADWDAFVRQDVERRRVQAPDDAGHDPRRQIHRGGGVT